MDKGESKLVEVVGQAVEAEAAVLAAAVAGYVKQTVEDGDPMGAEKNLREHIQAFGTKLAAKALEHSDWELRGKLRRDGHRNPQGELCHGSVKSKGYKETEILTLLGPMRLRRWTCVCGECGRWLGTVEEILQVEDGMSAACASAVALGGVTLAYEPAQKQLKEMAGIDVDDNRIHRTVGAVAERAKPWMEGRFEELGEGLELPPEGGTVYALVDGGRIRMREGKENPWREPCTALFMWANDKREWVRFGSSDPVDKEPVLEWLDGWMEIASCLGCEVVIIGDGAEWIWNWAWKYPNAIGILDYYHLKENVWKAARELYGEGTPRAARWVDRIMDRLWRGWVPSTIAMLEQMKPQGKNKKEERKALDILAGYLHNHSSLIKYGEHRNRGRCIGSGAIESLCKQLFTMRMKGPGMFWTESGARAVLSLRTVYLTGHWEELWKRKDVDLAA